MIHQDTKVHTVLHNGKICTLNPRKPWAQAIAIAGDRIHFVGSDEEARNLISPDTEVLDLCDQFVMPGFNDAHIHFKSSMLQELRELGITTAQTINDPEDLPEYLNLARQGTLTTRLELRLPVERWRDFSEYRALAAESHGLVTVDGLKGYIDGRFRDRTAFLLAPYNNSGSESGSLSDVALDNGVFHDLLANAASVGADISIHAIGDAGVRALLDHYERLNKKGAPSHRRLRVVHASLVSPNDIPRFGQLGLIAEVNPYHVKALPWLKTIIGEDRVQWAFAFRSLKSHGALLCFGSDYSKPSGETDFPLSPLEGIQAAILHENKAQRLTVKEALEAYTLTPALASGKAISKGTLEIGKFADLIVLSASPFELRADQIHSIQLNLTLLAGRLVFHRSS